MSLLDVHIIREDKKFTNSAYWKQILVEFLRSLRAFD